MHGAAGRERIDVPSTTTMTQIRRVHDERQLAPGFSLPCSPSPPAVGDVLRYLSAEPLAAAALDPGPEVRAAVASLLAEALRRPADFPQYSSAVVVPPPTPSPSAFTFPSAPFFDQGQGLFGRSDAFGGGRSWHAQEGPFLVPPFSPSQGKHQNNCWDHHQQHPHETLSQRPGHRDEWTSDKRATPTSRRAPPPPPPLTLNVHRQECVLNPREVPPPPFPGAPPLLAVHFGRCEEPLPAPFWWLDVAAAKGLIQQHHGGLGETADKDKGSRAKKKAGGRAAEDADAFLEELHEDIVLARSLPVCSPPALKPPSAIAPMSIDQNPQGVDGQVVPPVQCTEEIDAVTTLSRLKTRRSDDSCNDSRGGEEKPTIELLRRALLAATHSEVPPRRGNTGEELDLVPAVGRSKRLATDIPRSSRSARKRPRALVRELSPEERRVKTAASQAAATHSDAAMMEASAEVSHTPPGNLDEMSYRELKNLFAVVFKRPTTSNNKQVAEI